MSSDYNVDETIAKLDEAIKTSLFAIGVNLRSAAQDNCPVDTGKLRRSINFNVDSTDNSVTVASDVEYAPYVELKTHFLEQTAKNKRTRLRQILAENIKEAK